MHASIFIGLGDRNRPRIRLRLGCPNSLTHLTLLDLTHTLRSGKLHDESDAISSSCCPGSKDVGVRDKPMLPPAGSPLDARGAVAAIGSF
jgi:hypothetical protein